MWIYNFFLTILSWPALLLSNIWVAAEQRAQRRGKDLPEVKNAIWIHAASLGEINAIKPFIKQIQKKWPDEKIIISTNTVTGQTAAANISEQISTFYLPFDTYPIMRRTLRQLQPKLIIIAETELWPNLFYLTQKRQIPLEIINARISEQSYKIYGKTRFFWKKLVGSIVVNAKSEADAERFLQLGFRHVINAHNLKFCLDLPDYSRSSLRQAYGFSADDKLLVWGSSRPGEEELLRQIQPELLANFPDLKIIIVPRHLKRIAEVRQLFPTAVLSSQQQILGQLNIVDQMGLLIKFYAIADVAIIGGSFYDFGGHNPLEAIYYGVPTIIGSFHHSCQDSVEILQAAEGIVISDKNQLCTDIGKLLDPAWGKIIAENGKAALESNRNSLEINIARTAKLLERS